MPELFKNWLHLVLVMLLATLCTIACAQEREEDEEGETAQIEKKDADAAKRVRKGERKSRQEKKSGKTQLPPPPATSAEFEFFDGAIFSRKINLGLKNVLCFASERRPLAMLWRETEQTNAGREGGANLAVKLSPRELQLIFGRPVEAAQISVLNENGQMLARGTAMQVTFALERRSVYLFVEITPSRPRAAITK